MSGCAGRCVHDFGGLGDPFSRSRLKAKSKSNFSEGTFCSSSTCFPKCSLVAAVDTRPSLGVGGGASSWNRARIAVQPALPVFPIESLLTPMVFEPQKPSPSRAEMTGPTGVGLVSLDQDLLGCREIQLPRNPSLHEVWKGSRRSSIAFVWVIKEPRPTAVTTKDSQPAAVLAASMKLSCHGGCQSTILSPCLVMTTL